MSNSADPDEMAHEPSHLDLCCLQSLLLLPVAVKDLNRVKYPDLTMLTPPLTMLMPMPGSDPYVAPAC